MSRIKYAVAGALAAFLETKATALAGRAKAIQQSPQKIAEYPTAAVLPGRFTFDFSSALEDVLDDNGEAVTDGDGNPLVQAGTLEGAMQIWLAAEYPTQREDIQGRILSAFVEPGRLGAITLTIDVAMYAPDMGITADVGVYLDGEEWREEMVFSERRWAILDLTVSIPITIALDAADYPVVTALQIAITEDLDDVSDAATPEDALDALDAVETYQVAADGSYSEV